jgi:nucleoside-diphosphate-sugar epimerase
MEKVLVTGGFGFVGSQLVASIPKEYDVTVLDNMLSGDPLPDIKYIDADIRDQNRIATIIPKYDTIIHLAGIVGEPACSIDPYFSYDVNVIGTRNILQAMRKEQRIIFASSTSVYGNRPNEVVLEDSKPLPINNYARHKYQAEQDIQRLSNNYIIVRPATAFGVSHRIRLDLLVNTLIYNGLSYQEIELYEPHVMRPIIHVADFANILVYALKRKLGNNEIYNIGDPAYTMTKFELAAQIAIYTGAKITLKDGESLDPRNYAVSFQKLLETGFTFGTDRLEYALLQIKSAQYTIARNRELFSTPFRVRLFLERETVKES